MIQVNAFHAQTAQRGLAFLANRFGFENAARLRHGIAFIPNESALGEHKWPLGWWEFAEQPTDKFLGMTQAVDGRGVNPIDAEPHGMPHSRKRLVVVLRTPAVAPAASADGPSAKANGGDAYSART